MISKQTLIQTQRTLMVSLEDAEVIIKNHRLAEFAIDRIKKQKGIQSIGSKKVI